MIMSTLRRAPQPATQVAITLSQPEPVQRTDPCYLSWSIDISVFAGGFWWEGTDRARRGMGTLAIPPIKLKSRKLNRLVSNLAPAYLRIGGSEADKVRYFTASPDEPNALVVKRKQWDELHAFVQRHNLKLIFTCKYGLFSRRDHGNWAGDELETLLRYSRDRGYEIDTFELGNELNAYWAFHGLRSQPGPRKLAQDYEAFIELVRRYYPQARISGPGSAFWPRLGETIRPFTNITPRFLDALETPLDIVDWHYYPFQSDRSPVRTRGASEQRMLNPASLEDFAIYSAQLSALRDRYQPDAELWTGETGSAQCGGQPYLSDRWISSFWWLDQLGRGAVLGQRVMVRQSLIGGDYALIDRLTRKPRPDFWTSWLWLQFMGDTVYRVESSHPWVRAYLHDHPGGKGRTLLLINLSVHHAGVTLHGVGSPFGSYAVTAKRPVSRKIRINGERPKLDAGRASLDAIPPGNGHVNRLLTPRSINFWRLPAPQH